MRKRIKISQALCRLWIIISRQMLKVIYRYHYRRFQKDCYEGIQIVGDENLRKYVKKSLAELKTRDTHGFFLVKTYLSHVVETAKRNDHAFIIRAAFVEKGYEHLKTWTHKRYAGYLVRIAVRSRILNGFHILKMSVLDKQCQRLSFVEELRSLKRLGCEPQYLEQMEMIIDRLKRKS